MLSNWTLKHLCPKSPLYLLNNGNVKKIYSRTFTLYSFNSCRQQKIDVINGPQSSWKYVENMYVVHESTVKVIR